MGLDAHMATIAVTVADEGGDVQDDGANDPRAVRKMVQRLSAGDAHLRAANEAGPTGYDPYCQVCGPGVARIVAARSLIRVDGSR